MKRYLKFSIRAMMEVGNRGQENEKQNQSIKLSVETSETTPLLLRHVMPENQRFVFAVWTNVKEM